MSSYVFGPVPSRRLGKSIGINNIPPKVCSYACIYCQLGRAIKMDYERKTHYNPQKVIDAVKAQIDAAEAHNEHIDYLTFVPDGESALDANLGNIIDGLKPLPYKTAIITNSSLIDRDDVRRELMQLDLVSVKVDAADAETWRKINHPHKALDFRRIVQGLQHFANEYQGKLITETMLIRGTNDTERQLDAAARLVAGLEPATAYISIPTRSPARKDVLPATEIKINEAYQVFTGKIGHVEYLIGHEGNEFAHTGNTKEDILSITAVHPMREDSVSAFLEHDHQDWSLIEQLIKDGLLLETSYGGYHFYVRKMADYQQI